MHETRLHVWLAVSMLLSMLACAVAKAQTIEGRDYKTLATPQRTQVPAGKIQVIEFFSYGCPSCYGFHPYVDRWSAKLPAKVEFVRVPVTLGYAQWEPLSRTFYALQATGDLKRLDGALFNAIHEKELDLFAEQRMVSWVISQGVDAEKFKAAYASKAVRDNVARAEQMARAYGVDVTPRIAVAGRYIVIAKTAESFEDVLRITDQVVTMAAKK